jgi:hypothetical protein
VCRQWVDLSLQALRYVVMVSEMTFEQLVDTYQRHLTLTDVGTGSAGGLPVPRLTVDGRETG